MDARRMLSRAAMQGIFAALATVPTLAAATAACSKQETTSVTAPMEAASAPSPSATMTASRLSPPPVPTAQIAMDEPQPKDCCRGKNDCKGQSGCASGSASCSGSSGCKGKNECKGKGTSCDDNDDTAVSPISPRAASGRGPQPANPTKPGNCCSGKNECKGKSGCRSARNPAGAGMNECKGKGTSCPRRH